MTTTEFSNEFDILYNSITSNQAPGLNEYEKSVFLTKAQWQILNSYANPRANKTQEGVDGSRKRQIDFSTLSRIRTLSSSNSANSSYRFDTVNSFTYELPEDLYIILNEKVQAIYTEDNTAVNKFHNVIPITYETYDRLNLKPYPYPVKRGVWRLISNSSGTTTTAELIFGPNKPQSALYKIRYIRKPMPIILEDFSSTEYTIDGQNTAMTSELPEELHNEILQRGVELAIASYSGDLSSQVGLGGNSQTSIGFVSSQQER
jgi:hypothetical protein